MTKENKVEEAAAGTLEQLPSATGMVSKSPSRQEVDLEPLADGEVKMLRKLEAKNKELTIAVGDAVMVLEEHKKVLNEHRMRLREAYLNISKSHCVLEGKIDSTAGHIIVARRGEVE
jgi:hypothetical protein